jgi:hypothetical protein
VDDDSVRRALTDNYVQLARAVVAQAALELAVCRNPNGARKHLTALYRALHRSRRNIPKDAELDAWAARRARQLTQFFKDCGEDIAIAADCHHYFRLAVSCHLSRDE